MLFRVMALGVWPLVLGLRCSGDPGGSGGGDAGEGGESAGEAGGGSKAGGGPPTAGKAGGGSGAVAGTGGQTAGSAGVGGSAEGGGASCVDDVGVMPAGPLVPAAAECASGCSVPPFDGVTLPVGCGDASNEPPAAALTANLGGVPPGGLIVGDVGEPPQVNGPPMTGAPCDVGWCAGIVPTELTIGVSTSSGPFLEHTAMKVGAGELVHLARAQDLFSFDYVTVSPTGIVSRTEIDPETWAEFVPSPVPDESGGWLSFGNPVGPAIGVDPRSGQNHVYVAYAGVEPQFFGSQTSGPRFGVVVGENPGFEDLPVGWDPLSDIQVDENGDAIVLQKGRIYRHVTGGNWDEVVEVPCGIASVTGLVIDTENAVWYLMSSDNTLYRRAADGSWTKTASPGGKPVLAGGTVHLVSGLSVVHRVGTEWSQPLVPPLGNSSVTPTRVAIDSCWAPHAASADFYDATDYLFEMDYTRWTSRGFLTLRRVSNDYPGVELAVTPEHAFVHGGGGVFVVPVH